MTKITRNQNISDSETDSQNSMLELFQRSPIPESEILANLGVYLKRQDLMRILFMAELYQQVIQIPGDIYEFGVRWGQNMSLFTNLRGIFEPYNFTRRVFGFDTFEGFQGVSDKDGTHDIIFDGSYAVSEGYDEHLDNVLNQHQSFSPISHMKRFDLIKGNAIATISQHLSKYPESIVSLAYFDFDIYQPTVAVLEEIKSRLVRGSVIAFDELNHPDYPGETVAVRDVFGLDKLKLRRSPMASSQAYFIYDD